MKNPIYRILWAALLGSALINIGIAFALAPSMGSSEALPIPLLRLVFAGISLALGVGSLAFRKRALVQPIARGELDPDSEEGRARAMTPFVLNLVLSEAVGLFGLVLALVSGQPFEAVGFGLAAGVLIVLHRPVAQDLAPQSDPNRRGSDPTPIA